MARGDAARAALERYRHGATERGEAAACLLGRARELHREGYSAVGGAIDAKGFDAYAPGGGRHPRFPHPLVCPSLLPPLEPNAEVRGWPAYRPEGDEPAMFDGRLVLRLGRRR